MKKVHKISLEIFLHCVFGLVCFLAMVYFRGVQPSLSSYAKFDETAIIFKTWMIALAYGASRNKTLRPAMLPLICLAAFDSNEKMQLTYAVHHVAATLFFVVCAVRIYLLKNKSIGVGIGLGSLVLLYDLLWGELVMITMLYLFFFVEMVKLLFLYEGTPEGRKKNLTD